ADPSPGPREPRANGTDRRRGRQIADREAAAIEPRGSGKEVRDLTDRVRAVAEEATPYRAESKAGAIAELPPDELVRMIKDLERQMKEAAKMLEFEKAALLRDQIIELRRIQEVV